MSEERMFPILRPDGLKHNVPYPKEIPWEYLNEKWAVKNHSQSLERLKERGGLSPIEIVANIERKPLSYTLSNEDAMKYIFSGLACIKAGKNFNKMRSGNE